MEALANDPDKDVTAIKDDIRLSTFNLHHAKLMTKMYQHLESEIGKEITKAISIYTLYICMYIYIYIYVIIRKFTQIDLKLVCLIFLSPVLNLNA